MLYGINKCNTSLHWVVWLYALSSQLQVATEWDHASQKGLVGSYAKRYQQNFGTRLIDDDVTKDELKRFLPEDETFFGSILTVRVQM